MSLTAEAICESIDFVDDGEDTVLPLWTSRLQLIRRFFVFLLCALLLIGGSIWLSSLDLGEVSRTSWDIPVNSGSTEIDQRHIRSPAEPMKREAPTAAPTTLYCPAA